MSWAADIWPSTRGGFFGRDLGHDRNYSDAIAFAIDKEARAFVETAYNKAKNILKPISISCTRCPQVDGSGDNGRRGVQGNHGGEDFKEESALERTFLMVKPDGVERGLIRSGYKPYREQGLLMVAIKMLRISQELAEEQYAEHAGKPFFMRCCPS